MGAKAVANFVATDVAARGIDVPTITHVINYDLPKQAEDYMLTASAVSAARAVPVLRLLLPK